MKVCLFSAIFLVVVFMGCSQSSTPYSSSYVSGIHYLDKEGDVTSYLTENILDQRVHSFNQNFELLNTELKVYCQTEGSELTLASFQELWWNAMADFHYLEVLPVGPLSENKKRLSQSIYSLPLNKQDKLIDKEIKKAAKRKEKYRLNKNKNHINGLDSLEYVLFVQMDQSTEPADSCYYISALMSHLNEKVEVFNEKWSEYLVALKAPEVQTDLKDTFINMAANEVVQFVDKDLKDRKLAAPMGLKYDTVYKCRPGENCADVWLEHPFSNMAKESLLVHLQALRDIFEGPRGKGMSSGMGLSDYLVYSGAEPKSLGLSKMMRDFEALPEGENYKAMFDVEMNEENEIFLAYQSLQKFGSWLKVDFVADLNTELPGSVQGDND